MPPKAKLKINKKVNKQKVFDEIENYQSLITSLLKGIPSTDIHGRKIDARDYYNLANVIRKDRSIDNKLSDKEIDQYKGMLKSFLLDEKNNVNNYLDEMFKLIDELPSLYKNGVNTDEDFRKICMIHKLGQSISMFRSEYIEYFDVRYSTPELQKKFIANMTLLDQLSIDLALLKDKNPNLKFPQVSDLDDIAEQQSDINGEFSYSFSLGIKDNKNEFTYKVPGIFDYSLKCNETPPTNTLFDRVMGNSYTSYIGAESLDRKGSMNIDPTEYTFIGNKSLKEIALESLANNELYLKATNEPPECLKNLYLKNQIRIEFDKALVKGNQIISFVTPFKENGQVVFKETRLKPDVTDLEPTEEEINQHSWLRRKLSSWGIFKIKKDQSTIDRLYKNAPKINQTIIEKATAQFKKEQDQFLIKNPETNDQQITNNEQIKIYNFVDQNIKEFNDVELGNKIDDDLNKEEVSADEIKLDNEQTYKHRLPENTKEL